MITDWIAAIGVDLDYVDGLPDARLGAYLDDQRRILIRPGLTPLLEEQTLAHEFVHAYYRDRESTPYTEWRAWLGTARILIDPHEYAAAERISTSSLYIAQELGTTVRVIEVWRSALVRGEILLQAA